MEWFRVPQQRVSACLGILLSAYLIFLSLNLSSNANHWLNRLDFLYYDARFNFSLALKDTREVAQDHKIIILDIDEKSLANEGRWPWSRHKLAELVALLAKAGASVVAFDVVFSEPERNPVHEVNQHLANHNINWEIPLRWQQIADGDQNFARHMSDMDVVLGYFFQDEQNIQVGKLPPPVYKLTTEQASTLVSIEKTGFAANLADFQQLAAGAGFISTFADTDGVIRRSPMVIRHENDLYASFSLATVMSYLLATDISLATERVGNVEVITQIMTAGQSARTDVNGRVIIPFKGKKNSFPYLSASDVLKQKIDLSILEGAIVLVGTSVIGLSDLRTTPVGTQYPGVEVHANIIQALLAGEFPYRPEWEAGLTLFILAVLGAILSLLLPKLGPIAALLISLTALSLAVVGNFYAWHSYYLDLPIAAIILLILSLTLLNLAYGFLRESEGKRLLKGMFHQYVPQAHIDRMMADPKAYQFNGESKELTVLFADIRNFTSISESLSAEELKSMLNQYFTPITKIIFDHDGTIDKYVGDMVMAFWGAPLADENHAQNGILAALDMQQATRAISAQFVAKGLPEIHIGIGLNSGIMNVGDMGSSYRRAYTVLGDAVNLGSRLESITKFYGVDILVGERTVELCPQMAFSFIDRIQVKGKDEPIAVYRPLGLLAEVGQDLLVENERFTQAYELYVQQDWQQALRAFDALKADYESRLYDVYIERIKHLTGQALAADWDGIFRHTSK